VFEADSVLKWTSFFPENVGTRGEELLWRVGGNIALTARKVAMCPDSVH
jgi:hypothetical protein